MLLTRVADPRPRSPLAVTEARRQQSAPVLLPFCHVTLRGQKPDPPEWPRELTTLGDHLRRRRLDLGLLQRGVARLLGVHVNTVAFVNDVRTLVDSRSSEFQSILAGIRRLIERAKRVENAKAG